jgi:hypothetical protein
MILGGPKAKFIRVLGDITVAGQYVNGEPALLLWPSHRTLGVTPVAIALSSAYKYDEPAYLARASRKYAGLMGFDETDIAACHRIATVIHDHLLDLINMPPEETELVTLGEAHIQVNGGQKRIVEMTERR